MNKLEPRWILTICALLTVGGLSREAAAQCKWDTDCWKPRICVEGQCVEPQACATDRDCPKSDRCVQGACRKRATPGPAATTAPPPETPPAAPVLGGIGESCRARADCQAGLKCINQTCQDEFYGLPCGADAQCGDNLKCVQGTCGGGQAVAPVAPVPQPGVVPQPAAPPTAAPPAQPGAVAPQPYGAQPAAPGVAPAPGAPGAPGMAGAGPESAWMAFNPLDGEIHPHVGLILAPGVGHAVPLGGGGGGLTGFSMVFGVKGGIFWGNFEAQLEFSPVTWVTPVPGGPSMQMNATAGYYIPITDNLYYPLRGGLGFAAVNLPSAAFQLRADVVGLSYRVGHLMLDAHLPSFRFVSDLDIYAILNFHFGLGATYAF